MALPLAVAAAAQGAEIAGHELSRTLFGIASLISESARNVRVNQEAARSLSRQVDELVAVVSAEPDADSRRFQAALESIHEFLHAQAQRSYLSQIIHQDGDAAKLNELRTLVKSEFSVLQLAARFRLHALADAVIETYESSAALDALAQSKAHLSHNQDLQAQAPPTRPLPSRPQLFFGRAHETDTIVDTILGRASATYIAVLGGPGMGKTSLALAVLHDPAIAERFGDKRHFVACDAAETNAPSGSKDKGPDCIAVVAGAFGILSASRTTTERQLLSVLSGDGEPVLLVLDNFESAWEADAHRVDAEAFLSLLSSLPNVSLLLTLRGAERPRGCLWTRPYVPPLAQLSEEAATQAFLSISGGEEDENVRRLLRCVDCVPLAVELMANLAQYETGTTLLSRWEEQQTAMLHRGSGLSSLDVSIALALRSPRMQNDSPGALQLLSLFALLPDGVVDTDVHLWATSIPSSARSLSTLLQTALASRTSDRVRVLAPIRAYILAHHAPSDALAAPLLQHYYALISVFRPCDRAAASASDVARELRNTESVLRYALMHSPDPASAVDAAVGWCRMVVQRGIGAPDILFVALDVARKTGLEDLTGQLMYQWAYMASTGTVPGDVASLLRDAKQVFERTGNVKGIVDTSIHLMRFDKPDEALANGEGILKRGAEVGERQRARCLQGLARVHERLGDTPSARASHSEAVAILRASTRPELTLVGFSLSRLAYYSLTFDAPLLGVANLREALPILRSISYTVGVGNAEHALGETLLLLGDADGAVDHLTKALESFTTGGYARHQVQCLCRLVEVHLARADAYAAAEALRQAAARDDGTYRAYIAHAEGLLALWHGEAHEARVALRTAWAGFSSAERDPMIAQEIWTATGAETLCALAQAEGRSELFLVAALMNRKIGWTTAAAVALSCLDDEDVLCAMMLPLLRFGYRPALARALLRSGEMARRKGQYALARQKLESSMQRFEDIKDRRGADDARVALDLCRDSH